MTRRTRLRRNAPRMRGRADSGFSLIGVMAAGGILSVLALCLVQCWAVFDRMSFDLLQQQKAALVLNGEMERIWSVYTSTSFGLSDTTRSDYPSISGLPNSSTRVSYTSVAGVTASFTTNSASAFTSQTASDSQVFLGSGTPPLNWVWLDVSRNQVARLSWRTCQIVASNNDLQPCWGIANSNKPPPKPPKEVAPFACYGTSSGACEMLTAILEYPYSFNSGSPQAVGTTRTLTLSTIVGQRR